MLLPRPFQEQSPFAVPPAEDPAVSRRWESDLLPLDEATAPDRQRGMPYLAPAVDVNTAIGLHFARERGAKADGRGTRGSRPERQTKHCPAAARKTNRQQDAEF